MRNRARETYDTLVHLVKRENLPPISGQGKYSDGGIILAGWSFAALWMLAFLAYAPSFPSSEIDLTRYVRRVVLYGALIVQMTSYSY